HAALPCPSGGRPPETPPLFLPGGPIPPDPPWEGSSPRDPPGVPGGGPVRKISADMPASSLGSCLGVPSAAATSAITSRAPSIAAAFPKSARLSVLAALVSASTTSTVSPGAWLARTSRCLCGENPPVSPGCGARLSTSSRRAVVTCSAEASSGTSRCGSTLVNHEPGPNTTQSASSTARTASGTAGGSGGSSVIDRTWPGVVAHSTCPRTVLTSSGLAGSAPTTSATMSSGTAAIGSTRPPVPSSRPTQSRPATVSPSRSHKATMSRLPTAWPARSQSPPNRCCTTLLQVVPHSSSPHSAASAILRSPGGRTPKSRRSRPLDPPSSATVTIAMSSSVTLRNADSDAASPCPPPSATALRPVTRCSLPPQIPVHHLHVRARSQSTRDPCRQFVGDRHAPVLAAGAAHREGDEPLALMFVAGQHHMEQLRVMTQELLGARLGKNVLADRLVLPCHRGKFGNPVGVGQEPAVRHLVGVHRQAVFEAERDNAEPQSGCRAAAEEVAHSGPQLVHVEPGRVQDQVGVAAHLAQQFALGRDAVGDPAVALHRVRPPLAVEPAHQRLLGGLEVDHPGGGAARAEVADGRLQIGAERAAAHVDHRSHPGDRAVGPGREVDHGGQQARRQVVDHEPAQVLERLGGGGPPCPGQAGDNDD